MQIINGLLRGIESWAADCDGIHQDCYDAYHKAKVVMCEFDHLTRGEKE